MAYEDAFAAVPGCTVEWCEYFGSYQGQLAAKIKYKGETLYIIDYYGSCSGCDAFEGEFGYGDDPTPEQLASFGKPYVEGAYTLDEAIKKLSPVPGEWYDTDDKEALDRILADYPGRTPPRMFPTEQ